MSRPNTSVSKRATRSQNFAVVLLVFLYMAQPAFALVGLLCSDQSCSEASEQCCCEGPAELPAGFPAEVVLEDTCCDEEQQVPTLGDGSLALQDCSCQVEPTPLPQSDPALPLRVSDAAGDCLSRDWLQAQAQIHSRLSTGPPGANLPAWVGTGTLGVVPPSEVDGSSACRAKSVGAWALATRGVGGFLAVLSVARL